MAPSDGTSRHASDVPRVTKRAQVRAACHQCRARKTRVCARESTVFIERIPVLTELWCDTSRPACNNCISRRETCVYATQNANETRPEALRRENKALNNRLQQYEKLFNDLASLPTKDAVALFRSRRDSVDLNPALFHVESPQQYHIPDYRILDRPLRQAPLFPVTSDLQADLLVSHSKAYPKILAFENPQSIAKRLLSPSGSHQMDDITR